MRPSILIQQCLLLLLALFLVRGIDDTDASESIQTLSTGETPTAFVQNKIDTHDVSVVCNAVWHAPILVFEDATVFDPSHVFVPLSLDWFSFLAMHSTYTRTNVSYV